MTMGALGLGLTVGSQIAGGFAENSQARGEAAVLDENARRAEMDAALKGEAIRRSGRATQGEAIAALAANGVGLGTGSALDLLRQSAIEEEYDWLNTQYQGASEAASLRTTATQRRAGGKNAIIGGFLRAGAAALTGMDDLKNRGRASGDAAAERAARRPGGMTLPVPAQITSRGYVGTRSRGGMMSRAPAYDPMKY